MSLVQHYRDQLAWRDWATVIRALPDLSGTLAREGMAIVRGTR